MRIEERHGLRVATLDDDAESLSSGTATADLIGTAAYDRVDVLVVPVERVDPAFFVLGSGVAGDVAQRVVNYRLRLAIVGDIASHVEASDALRAYVEESQRGGAVWFVADDAALEARLATAAV